MARHPKELERDVEVQDTPSGLQTRRVAAVKLRDLLPDPKNANKGTPRGRALLEDSLRRYGAGRSLLADKHGVIIAGNKTAEVAADIGLEDVIIVPSDGHQLVVVQRTDLDLSTDPAAKELAIADNRTSQVSLDWDVDLLQQVAGEGVDLSRFWTTDELDALLAREPTEGLTDPDAVPEERPTDIVRGDLFALGTHRLLCGDSTNAEDVARVMDGAVPVMLWADPPFSRDYESRGAKGACEKVGSFEDLVNSLASRAATVSAWYIKLPWFDCPLAIPLLKPNNLIVWAKQGFGMGGGDFRSQHEFLLYGRTQGECSAGKDIGDVWTFAVPFRGRMLHVAETPAALIVRAIGFNSSLGDVVLDPFSGSGTTIIAAEQLGRRCYAIEIEPRYVQVAIDRWEQFTGQKATKL